MSGHDAVELRRAGGEPMRLAAAGGAPAMWSHQPPSAAAITFYVRCGGAAQDAAACLEALVPGVAARIAEVMIDIPAAHGAELAAGLRRHGCHAPLRVVAARGGEALAHAFEQAKGDWIAVVDARCRAFASGWLERLEQGVVGRFTAGIAADIIGANGERLPGAWVLGGGAWSVAGPAPAGDGEAALATLYG